MFKGHKNSFLEAFTLTAVVFMAFTVGFAVIISVIKKATKAENSSEWFQNLIEEEMPEILHDWDGNSYVCSAKVVNGETLFIHHGRAKCISSETTLNAGFTIYGDANDHVWLLREPMLYSYEEGHESKNNKIIGNNIEQVNNNR